MRAGGSHIHQPPRTRRSGVSYAAATLAAPAQAGQSVSLSDRYGRSLQDLINMVAELRERGIGFTSLRENLDTTTPGGRLVFHVFAALAEFIRELIVIGTKEGLAAARARGRVGGRPSVATEEIIRAARDLLPDPGRSITSIAKLLGVSPGTLYNHIPDLRELRAGAVPRQLWPHASFREGARLFPRRLRYGRPPHHQSPHFGWALSRETPRIAGRGGPPLRRTEPAEGTRRAGPGETLQSQPVRLPGVKRSEQPRSARSGPPGSPYPISNRKAGTGCCVPLMLRQ
ncbi:recombinase family protein [Nonomuraea sp. NPDC050536]|uniref:recombinase family protein n=1 Tax=Nonomuraea sp. NPDC050536 TaxID=3364366 RepID=UPI0037CCA6FA